MISHIKRSIPDLRSNNRHHPLENNGKLADILGFVVDVVCAASKKKKKSLLFL